MGNAVPGFVPRMLVDPDVGLFRADERVFTAMLDGWRAQMLARGLTTQTIKQRGQLLERFQRFTGEFPWQWRPADVDDFLADLRSGEKPISLKTLRSYSNAVAMFCSYLTHPGYGWGEFCERIFGDIPSQICFEWNMPRHTTDDAVPAQKRSFTKAELQRLFDYIDDLVDREYASGSKRWLPLFRDSVAFKVCYAYGLRRREMTMLDLEDFGPKPHVGDYGRFGAVQVRFAKGTAGSGPRRRTVLTVPEFDWVVDQLKTWTSGGLRQQFPTAERSSTLWPSERGARMSLGSFGDAFAAARDAVGLPQELGLHCLRHSYVTHLIEAGYDAAFVQIIWSLNRGVLDVRHEARNRAIPRDGGAYLKLSITRDRGRVNAGSTSFGVGSQLESWTVLDDHGVVEPVERFLAYLTDVERSPNTLKAYAHDLKDWFVFLRCRGVD